MKPKLMSKYLDILGIVFLTLFLYLSVAFRASPISFMNPGFPILSEDDWTSAPSITLNWNEYPQKYVSKDKFSEVAYIGRFHLDDYSQMVPNPYVPTRLEPTNFSGFHTVIKYSEANYAISTLHSNYKKHINELKTLEYIITEIPGLNFSSRANAYYIWCEQISAVNKGVFDTETVGPCFYWAVYGEYYSEIRFSMWPFRGDGRQYSVELFNDVLNRADKKLSDATK